MNMDIWMVGTSNQLYIQGSYTKTKFLKKEGDYTGKILFFVIGQFCIPHSICLNIGFWESSFVNLSTFN